MRDRLLLAIDQFDPGQAAVDFTIGLAAKSKADVEVLHVRELPRSIRIPPLETVAEAQQLVDETVMRMRTAGIEADGRVCSAREDNVAGRIVEESTERGCDAIVLGSLRLRGLHSILGHGVRERVLKLSPLPVIVTPTALRCDRRGLALR
ncbi:MAG: universal stress protein [Acidimicrobiales bacterium]|jgi:nucleotide-binding universal stress UspA family protein